jgi:hypothetical protein
MYNAIYYSCQWAAHALKYGRGSASRVVVVGKQTMARRMVLSISTHLQLAPLLLYLSVESIKSKAHSVATGQFKKN